MKKNTLGLGTIVLAAALTFTACGASESDLASEYCDLAKKSADAAKSGDPEKVKEANEDLLDWAEDNKDATGDEDKFLKAVEKECGDLEVTP